MRNNRVICLIAALMLLAASANQAFAQKKPQPGPTGLSDAQVTERLSYIENALYSAQPHAQGWWYSWMAVYASATIVQGTLAGYHWNDWRHDHHPLYTRKIRNRAFAEDMLIGGCTTALGVGGLLITPFKSAYLPDRLRSMPANTAAERQAKLLQAEDILRQCAEVEADGWGWMPHVLNLVVNIGAGLTTVLAFNRPWTDGLITFGESEAVSLLNIFTQPRKNLKALKNYEAKYKGGDKTGHGDGYDNEIFFTLVPGGVGIGMKF
ncbi:MAG TPA: hypothetical protein PLM53_15435 [Spirochaetota bacterium]|nr:hypothetical protein [Spirochaetota bacterium]HPC39792.1 hypothetical protein [Spirochaetota bacterium]HPL17772.1 hypothetical protein [Spirochaetota bacterium]HQF09839.1 hypothetical protein [Spirochaetota bacterium]HQH98489.1 hypothetical protein [Spirochaetota bacterium]